MNENNFNKSYDTSTTGGAYTNITYNYADGCLYRLPCGYCKILEKVCPMHYNFNYAPPYNLNQVICKTVETCMTGEN